MLIADLKFALEAVVRFCPSLANEPEERLAALVDFTFNLGARPLLTSTLRHWVNEQNWLAGAAELRWWVLGGGKVLPRLMARRQAAVALLVG